MKPAISREYCEKSGSVGTIEEEDGSRCVGGTAVVS